ncbi:MAG: hypothetical protein IJ144_02145 [Prevotella sp.]|nr:hypothetical protein [Prevotella sp.]
MKKISLYIMALLTMGLVACDEDFAPTGVPQTNPQESLIQVSDITVSPIATSINIPEIIGSETPIDIATVAVKEGAMPANTILKAKVEVSNTEDFAKSVTLDAQSMANSNVVSILPSELQRAYFDGITHNPNTKNVYVRTILYTVTNATSDATNNAEAIIGQPGDNYFDTHTVSLTPVDEKGIVIADKYYIVGTSNNWGETDIVFDHSDADVYDDPVFRVSFPATKVNDVRVDTEFSIVAIDDLTAYKNGDKSVAYGLGDNDLLTKGAETFLGMKEDKADLYSVTINMETMECTVTPLQEFAPYVYFIGATDGWKNAEQRLYCANVYEGVYTGYIYCADPNGWGNEFKFQKVAGDWGTELNSGTFAGAISGDLADGGSNIKATAGEGVYYFEMNLALNTLKATRITNMNLVGDFNGWNAADDAQQMTWNTADYCFEITGAGVTANGWKFTANNGWDINLGGDINNLVGNGSNLSVVGTTIKLYPTRRNNDNIVCTVE